MKLSAMRGLYTGRKITLLASIVCMSLVATGCNEDAAVIEKVDTVNINQSNLATNPTEAAPAVESVAIKAETNAERIKKEIAQKALYAKEQAKIIAASSTNNNPAGSKRISISNVYVVDGDTIHGNDSASGERIKVRMTGIDAPEKEQPLGKESENELRNCIGGERKAELVIQSNNEKDKYGRTLARVEAQGINCNQQQLEKGMAWFYEDFADKLTSEEYNAYNKAHHYAQDNMIGVWQLPSNNKKPWEYRAEKK